MKSESGSSFAIASQPFWRKCCQDPETIKIIENQHETQMDHIIKLRTSAESKFTMQVKTIVKF